MAAAFITFEGIDGSGKSTQLRMLASELTARGLEVVTTREPGGTPLGASLRHALLDAEAEVDPLAELLLYAADRAQHVRTLIRPQLAAGRIVISDRYSDATVAYQGAGRGFPVNLINEVVQLATEGLKPDLTLVFDLDVEEGRLRQTRRTTNGANKSDRLDMETDAFHTRVREAYQEIARREPERVRVIDASGSIAETHLRAVQVVELFLAQRGTQHS
ncbi:MAG: dTMP kinase [Pyrinomonadaceae bacterium]|nr:dTMP kinase [Pyrinomonadaceae bacterium]